MVELNERIGCFNTRSGRVFNFLNPTPEMIDIGDICFGLAFKPHFGGQTPNFFSIAQHSILVSELLEKEVIEPNARLMLTALLHDASEAYIGDMIKPIKELLPKFVEIENNIQEVIFKKYGLQTNDLKIIKPFDIEAQQLEFDTFYRGLNKVSYMTPKESARVFLERFKLYYSQINKCHGIII